MAEGSEITYVSGLHANNDAKFFEDVYIYGTLHYDLEGYDSLDVDQLNTQNLNVSGIATLAGSNNFSGNSWFTGITTFSNDVNIDYLDVNRRFRVGPEGRTLLVTDENGWMSVGIRSDHINGEALEVGGNVLIAGPNGIGYSVGIGSTRPEQRLDVSGSVKIDRNIYDSINSPGSNGFYLQRDNHGIRWVAPSPAQLDGIIVQNEGNTVGSNPFTTLNLIGTGSGGDLVDALVNASNSNITDIHIRDQWVKNASGIHTMGVNVGINVANPLQRLHVGGTARFDGKTEVMENLQSTSPTDGAFVVSGGVGIAKRLNVAEEVNFDNKLVVEELTKLNESLEVEGGVNIYAGMVISGFTTGTISTAMYTPNAGFATNSHRAGFATFADFAGISTYSIISGFSTNANRAGVSTFADFSGIGTYAIKSGFATNTHRAGFATYSDTAGIATFVLNAGITTFIGTKLTGTDKEFFLTFVDNAETSAEGVGQTIRVDPGINYNPSSNALTVDGNLTVGDNTKISGTLELDSHLIDVNNSQSGPGVAQTDYVLTAAGIGVSWRAPGVETSNAIWVSADGNDANSGLLEGDAKRTIGAAAAIAESGDTIIVRSGVYKENNPIGLRTDVAVSGEDLRLVTVVPLNNDRDVFHVRRGCLVQNLNFAGQTSSTLVSGGAVAFPPLTNAEKANTGYIGLGPANEGPRRGNPALGGRYKSPYVRNCTNFMTGSIGMKIDGNHVDAAYTGTNNLGQDIKSMVCDSFTQYNEAGIGVSITNKGYAQLVSIFTISCDIAIYCDSGGQCDLTNSNSSFGNYGLYADGVSGPEYTGVTTSVSIAELDSFLLADVKDVNNNFRKPFDGQAMFFKVDLDDYPDSPSTGVMTQPFQLIREIKITNGGSGYSETAPPNVTVSSPQGPESILAELSANVSAAGTVTSIDVIASGRNFLPVSGTGPTQSVDVTISGIGGATATAIMDPIYYTVNTATTPSDVVGLSTLTLNEFVPYSVDKGSDVEFRRISRIITSSHSFEYVGAGTDINRANPFQGGEPIPENEIVAINGGQVPFTSTDQKGNFRIGEGLTIDQTTSTISGRDFNRAIQAQLTPLILALK